MLVVLWVVVILGTSRPRSVAVRSSMDDASGVALFSPTLWENAVSVTVNISIAANARLLVIFLISYLMFLN